MAGTPSNSMNLNTTTTGLVNWDGIHVMSTTPLIQYYTLAGATASTVQNIAPGTAGWVYTSGGASAYPSFVAPTFIKMPWTDEATSFAAASNHGYFVTATATATLPSAPAQGDQIDFAVNSVSGILTIQANTGQTIQVGTAISATAGTAVSNFNGDSISLIYQSASTNWISVGSPEGTFTVT